MLRSLRPRVFFIAFVLRPLQPQQQYDENCERVALRRRCPEDDQWVGMPSISVSKTLTSKNNGRDNQVTFPFFKVVPHELYLAMFSPATINVLPFDPHHGSDQARQYAAKYVWTLLSSGSSSR